MENTNKTLMIVLIVVLVLLLFGNFGYGMMGGLYSGFMFLGWILNVVLIVLIILGVYWLVKHISYDGKNLNYDGRKIR